MGYENEVIIEARSHNRDVAGVADVVAKGRTRGTAIPRGKCSMLTRSTRLTSLRFTYYRADRNRSRGLRTTHVFRIVGLRIARRRPPAGRSAASFGHPLIRFGLGLNFVAPHHTAPRRTAHYTVR